MVLRVGKADLDRAAAAVGLDAKATESLWRELEQGVPAGPRFDAVHVLCYFGALVVILGMVVLVASQSQWGMLTGTGIAVISGLYASIFLAVGHWLWTRHPNLRIPGGLLVVMAVSMTPVVVYGLERALGIWPFEALGTYNDFHGWIRSGWFAIEVATIAAGCVALVFYRFPFLTAPIAAVLWYMSMDLAPIVFDIETDGSDVLHLMSLVFGLAMLAVAYAVDLTVRRDFAFWLYLFGLIAFWGGLSLVVIGSDLGKAIYCLINLGLIALSVFLRRRTFMVFGVIGVIGYVSYPARKWFEDDILFTVALSAIGLAILGLGVWLSRYRHAVDDWVERVLPSAWQRLRPD